MARANTCTLLSLDRFAKILGINPLHFNGAAGSEVMAAYGNCGSVYPQYTWQVPDNLVSREEIAQAIYSAEQDIKRVLGFSPAPDWECAEHHSLSKGLYGMAAPIKTRYARLIQGGKRAATMMGVMTVEYNDLDNDTLPETATATMIDTMDDDEHPPLTEWHVFFRNRNASCQWEIRYPQEYQRLEGAIQATIPSWLLLDPAKVNAVTTLNGFHPLDPLDMDNYVTEIELWRVYNDPTIGAEIYPVGCAWDSQETCLSIHNRELGFAYPEGIVAGMDWYACMPQYDALDATIWYYAGDTTCGYDEGDKLDPLSDYWAQTITWMAAARLEKPLCSCTNVQTVVASLQRDTAMPQDAGGNAMVDFRLIGNPFGTRVGEIRTWQRVMNMENAQVMSAGVF